MGFSIMTQQAPEEGQEYGDHILSENAASAGSPSSSDRVWIFGIPIAPLTMVQTVEAICDLIEVGRPAYVITANTHYAMLSERHVDLSRLTRMQHLSSPMVRLWFGLRAAKGERYPSESQAPTYYLS